MRFLVVIALLLIPASAWAQTSAPPIAEKCEGRLSQALAQELAEHWIAAWNSHKADTIMALYTEDFEMRSHYTLNNPRISDPSGVLKGQAKNRLRWFGDGDGNQTRWFDLIGVFAGVRSIAIHYKTATAEVIEVEEFAPDCKIERSNALYGPPKV
jgi:hypothetical protein